jgi:ribose-phosphate pyrophosphokinase
MTTAIRVLKNRFDLSVSYVSCVHGVLAEGAIERILEAGVKRIVITDTLPSPDTNGRVKVVSVAPLLAAAIRNIHTNESVTQIFEQPNFLFSDSQRELWS